MLEIKAAAKINMGLDITDKRDDGYHNIDTIMHEIGLYDELTIKKKASGIEFKTDNRNIPKDENNLVVKAAKLFFSHTKIADGVWIYLKKNIPTQGGLGGGSSDAAAIIKGLNQLYQTQLDMEEQKWLCNMLGSDVPFFIEGKTQRAKGKGEQLQPIQPPMGTMPLVILQPKETVSTPWAYGQYQSMGIQCRPNMDTLEKIIQKKQYHQLDQYMINVFEELVFPHKSIIKKAKYDMIKTNPLACAMSGSGSCIFGIYGDDEQAKKGWAYLKEKNHTCYLTNT